MLSSLREDIGRLVALYETQKKRADSLESELAEVRIEAENSKMQINKLNQEISNLKLGSAFTSNGNNSIARESIDRLLREIDKCIKLLEN